MEREEFLVEERAKNSTDTPWPKINEGEVLVWPGSSGELTIDEDEVEEKKNELDNGKWGEPYADEYCLPEESKRRFNSLPGVFF
jgi:hypothetical protein